MDVSFPLPAVLRLFKHLRGTRDQAVQTHPQLRITAVEGQLFLEHPQLAVSVEALVLEPGAFTFHRLRFETLLKSFSGHSNLTLKAGPDFLQIGRQHLSLNVEGFDPTPRVPPCFSGSKFGFQPMPGASTPMATRPKDPDELF